MVSQMFDKMSSYDCPSKTNIVDKKYISTLKNFLLIHHLNRVDLCRVLLTCLFEIDIYLPAI